MSKTELPPGWVWARLGDLGTEQRNAVRPQSGAKYELWSVPSFATGSPERLDGSEIGSVKLATQPNDILICKINPRINRVWRTSGGRPDHIQVASPEWLVLRLPESARDPLATYLQFYLSSPTFRSWITLAASGATGSHTRAKARQILDQLIPLPPLQEQRRIVETLEDHLSRLEVADSALAHAKLLIPLQTRSLFTSATEGRDFSTPVDPVPDFRELRQKIWETTNGSKKYKTPVAPDESTSPVTPNGWQVFSLEELTDPTRLIRYGILMPKVREGGSVPYVEVKDLTGGTLHGKKLHLTSKALDEKFAGARIRHGDVLLAVRGSYDRSAVVPSSLNSANVSRDVARISPLPGLDAEYLHLYLQSRFAQQYLKSHARGVAVKGVNIAAIRAMPVAVPPPSTQRKIVEDLQQKQTAIDAAVAAVTNSAIRSSLLRQSILARAFTGQLVSQDPDDEHASVAFDRIRAEHSSTGDKAKTTRMRRSRQAEVSATSTLAPPPAPSVAPASNLSTTVQQEFEF
ncbi:restriction endonuclease subunit S [Kitasatospora sp. NPDC101447]|uniref:restriction endonuclease subunit S n=1 Tax=Kitasatospora sp. NPDC101447 TaxID=3364102 RepID=UPI00382F7BE7